jgi:putative transcription factor
MLVEGSLLKVCPTCAKFGAEAPTSSKSEVSVDTQRGVTDRSTGRVFYSTNVPSKDEMIRRRLEKRERRMKSKDIYDQSGEKELVDDYHKRIQQARNDLGWNQEILGQKINERKSVISKLENKSMKPDDRLIRKLEKALGIKLIEVIE